MISDEIKSKIREWNRADFALFDAVNDIFTQKIEDYGFDKMQLEIKELRARIDELMKFCVADKTSFVPNWSEAAIEFGCQNQSNPFVREYMLVYSYILDGDTLVQELCFDRRRTEI